MKIDKNIAIIVPCFNEEWRFPQSYWREILAVENQLKWVFVDDGSFDGTGRILNEVCIGTASQVVKLTKNIGKGGAIRQGFLEVLEKDPKIQVLGYLDSDGAFSKEDVFRLAELISQTSLKSLDRPLHAVISARVALSGRQISRKVSRHYLGRIIATLLTNNWSDSPYDTQSGFKLFLNSEAFRDSIKTEFATKWFFDVEIITRIGIYNKGHLSIWEEPLSYWKDIDGSKLRVKHFFNICFELITARKQVLRLLKVRSRQSGSE
jgi:glycosyltransferase involved in cell wall biosynthesis